MTIYCYTLRAQLPNCNLYLFDFILVEDQINLKQPYLLTEFNQEGYNNQASFIDQENIIFSSNYLNPDSTDLWIINIEEDLLYQYTDTKGISEFSPRLQADESVTTVRIEQDGATQLLWKYPYDRSHFGRAISKKLTNVGYYEYVSENELILFLVDTTHQLVFHDLDTKRTNLLIENPGRTFKLDRNGNLIFIHKIGSTSFLKSYNFDERKAKTITTMPDNVEDFLLLNENLYLAGKNDKLLLFDRNESTEWKEVADLSLWGINEVTRMTKHRNKLVITAKHTNE